MSPNLSPSTDAVELMPPQNAVASLAQHSSHAAADTAATQLAAIKAEPSFVHLRLHSEYSIVDGLVRIDDAVKAATADGQGALALTDGGNLFGAVRFYSAARKRGIKPIIGADVWITNEADRELPFRLLLLVSDQIGYLNLCALLSRAWLENAHRGRGEMRAAWFDTAGDGLIALSGGPDGEIGKAFSAGQHDDAFHAASRLARQFPGRFYLEIQRAGRPGDESNVRASVALASKLGLPVVATHPVQFVKPEDFRAHEARVCIAEGTTLGDPKRPRRFTQEQFFQSRAQMAARFADLPAALTNAVQIARRCNLVLELGKPRLPPYPTPPGQTLDAHCRALSLQGLDARLLRLFPETEKREAEREKYLARLALELDTIAGMGFTGYFLIVADFINWAKGNAVPVGPGRGSGAGSLVAYALGITDLDPLKYDLLFERFLNPERVSMPDFDIDFCQDNRDKVIDYVKRKYGADAVSQIATFGTLGAKAVVRDAGRVLELPYTRCDQLSKLIPHNPADPWTLERALTEEPAFAQAVAADEEYGRLIELARPLEGLTRNVGMHAGGVLIAPGKLTDFCPLYCAPGAQNAVISQFDKDDVEAIGLVKFDFLGLTTLTILQLALDDVRRMSPHLDIQLDALPLDDPRALGIFRRGETTAIFQFESRGMRELLKRAKPDRLEDLIALNALYRPGPMELIPDYIERKLGRQRVVYAEPRVEPILAETYGVMVYQEQVMRIAQVVGGYSLGGADLLRRAMGKKKPEEMAKHRSIFVDGAGKNGVAESVATELFDLMEKFAGYGFNKSHSAAYALVAYQTAYFKAHFPAAFMAANMTAVMQDTDKLKELIEDCKVLNLKIEAPDVNGSRWRFEPLDAKTLRYGLGGMKGTGLGAIEALVAAREAGGRFDSLFELCTRVDRQTVNRRVIEALARGGAFDGVNPHRHAVLASVGRAMDAAEAAAASAGQASLFGDDEPLHAAAVAYVEVPRWTEREQLSNEKLALGFYFSGHLFASYEAEARRVASTRLADVRHSQSRNETVRLTGIVVSSRSQNTRRGRMGVIVLDDGTAQLEMMVFSELYDSKRALLKEDELVFVSCRLRYDENSQRLSVTADDVMDLAQARALVDVRVRIELGNAVHSGELGKVLNGYRVAAVAPTNSDDEMGPEPQSSGGRREKRASAFDGKGANGCRVVLHYRHPKASADIVLPANWRVRPDDRLMDELRRVRGVADVAFTYPHA